MKRLKTFALGVIAGAALLALVGASPAAAETVLCTESVNFCPAGKTDGVGTEIKANLVTGTKSTLTAAYTNIECAKSSITAKVTSTGKAISASVEGLTFEECGCTEFCSGCEVKVLGKGTLELEHIASTQNATVRSTGTEITTTCSSTIFGAIHCIYKTTATDFGTLESGSPAKLKISGAEIPRLATSALCAEKANWDAEYEVASPKPLYVPEMAVPVLCTEIVTPCPSGKAHGIGTEIKASLVPGTKSKLTTSYKTIECGRSSLTAKVASTGQASVESLAFEECNCEVKVLAKGSIDFEHIAASANATARSSGTEITTTCSSVVGIVHCIYKTEATDLGTLEGGSPAKFKISERNIPRLTTNGFCELEKSNWDAEYEVTAPRPLYAEAEAERITVCTEKTSPCPSSKSDGSGTEIKTSLIAGTKSKLTAPYGTIECTKSSLTAKVTSTGNTIDASLESLSFEECNCEVKVLSKGTLELQRIAGTNNATVVSTGTEVTTVCSTVTGNVHCIYKTTANDLGTLEGGNPAKIKVSGAEIPRLSTDARCNEGGLATKWDAEYEVTSPKPLYVEPE